MADLTTARGNPPHVWTLVAAAFWRRLRSRLRVGPLYSWRFSGRTPERLLIAPPDLRLADPQIALEIYHGRFPFVGYRVETAGLSPFEMENTNPAWDAALHGFRWLRHMRAAETELAAANSRALVGDWITIHGRKISGLAWEPAITAKRIIAWLQHSAVVLQGADYTFYRSFIRSLSIQIRYLRAMAPEMVADEEKLRARIALAFAALSLPSSQALLRNTARNLSAELDAQILPDGGHVSRNPEALLELLADLLPLRHTYSSQGETPPEALIGAVERMLPALRFFRHRDGTLARFNGMGPTSHDRIASILRYDDTDGAPLLHAPHSGYERLTVGTTTVVADTGTPPPLQVSQIAQAGCLSFEMSSGRHHFIVNCGMDTFGLDEYRPLARSTAAHSTATLNDTSSARFVLGRSLTGIVGSPLMDGPRNISIQRTDTDVSQGFTARHDGYLSRFGLYHERNIELSNDGTLLQGADRIFAKGEDKAPDNGQDRVNVRFHLHPDISLFENPQGALVLAAPEGERWEFVSPDVIHQVEESVFFAGFGGPRRTFQIVLSWNAAEATETRWQFRRL